ncbi:MAG: META domain-containing protein, partial [Propionibacteriaceae bacterium]|nr:META domain-containing protein [Propionibacteriaceae bacterium]
MAGVLAAAALAAGMALSSSDGNSQSQPDISGRVWALASWTDPVPLAAPAVITLELADGSYSGSGGVNRYNGPYTGGDGRLDFEPGFTTLMAGPPDL